MDPDSIIDIIGLPLAHVGLRGEDGARCQVSTQPPGGISRKQ